MGFNSVLFICNDAKSEIDRDPAGWWRKAWSALNEPDPRDREFGFGSHANGFQGVWNRHADYGGLIFVGGNRAEVLASSFGGWRGDSEAQHRLLTKAAAKIGYRLVRVEDGKDG